ncbi:MAG: beta-N-acetylhexosaminidase, partial [Moraxellaceae bacterium]
FSCGWVIGAELLSAQIDLCFAPVLDIDFGVSEVIGNRSFHSDPGIIAILAAAFIKGLNEAGMAAVGKHFPGHGGVAADSHVEIPVDSRVEEVIRQSDLVPFEALAGQLAGVMPAHVIYDQVDPNPAGFSNYWLLQVLRNELKFEGAIFSDDLTMQGASAVGGFEERTKQALAAGCDMVLVCNDRPGALVALEYLKNNPFKGVQERLQRLQGGNQFEKHLIEKQALEKSALWQGHIKNIKALILK